MLLVPIQSTPSQEFTISLSDQVCQISLRQLAYGLFFYLSVNNTPIIGGVVCENLNALVRSVYLGFIGDFFFFDTQGIADPDYTGLGTRFLLIYLEPSDL